MPMLHGNRLMTQKLVMEPRISVDLLQKIGRPVFVCVNLDALIHNMTLLADMCANKEAVRVAVVKGNAYGHGAVPVARHFMATGAADRLAVATVDEAIHLRRAGIDAIIHVLGNIQPWEMQRCISYHLIPTVASEQSIIGISKCLEKIRTSDQKIDDYHCCANGVNSDPLRKDLIALGTIHIKVDTGMSRNGCQPHELPQLIEACKSHHVPLEGILSMFSNTEDPVFSQSQMDTFSECIEPYRNDGYVFHMANSGAILDNLATDMDFIRPGISLYGMNPCLDLDTFIRLGFRPSLSVKGTPTLVKKLSAGSKVGYGCAYTCEKDEWVATFPFGYADGFWRELGEGKSFIIRDKTGEKCTVIGRISMDAITVQLPCQPEDTELFTIITSDFNPKTSVTGIAKRLGTIEHEILIRLSDRLPRVYLYNSGKIHSIQCAFSNMYITMDCDSANGVGH